MAARRTKNGYIIEDVSITKIRKIRYKFPWDEMRVGQSFVIPASEMRKKAKDTRVNVPEPLAASGYKIRTSLEDDGGLRVGRIN